MSSSVTLAQAFKAAFVAAAQTLVASRDPEVLVSFGHPGQAMGNFDDLVAFTTISVDQEPATLGTNRSRSETLTQTVQISCYRAGGPDREQVASDGAYELLGLLEHHVRVTDTTLGGLVLWCFLTSHTSTGETDPDLLASGRTIDIDATFTAKARVTGP